MEKTKPKTTKAGIHQSKKCMTTQKKLKPDLAAFCDIRPENGAGLFSKKR